MGSILKAMVLITLMSIAACGRASTPESPQIAVEDAWVQALPEIHMQQGSETSSGSDEHMQGDTISAYMILRNKGEATDYLISVQSEVAEVVEMHITQTEDGVSSMRRVERIEIPAGGKISLQPGGFHIMLINLKGKLNEGDTVKITLEFEQSGLVEVNAEVRIP